MDSLANEIICNLVIFEKSHPNYPVSFGPSGGLAWALGELKDAFDRAGKWPTNCVRPKPSGGPKPKRRRPPDLPLYPVTTSSPVSDGGASVTVAILIERHINSAAVDNRTRLGILPSNWRA